jgi:hypothetical protein
MRGSHSGGILDVKWISVLRAEVSAMPDPESYRAAREACADSAKRVTGPSSRTGDETTTRMVNAAVYRYEHREVGHHHHGLPPTEATGAAPPD